MSKTGRVVGYLVAAAVLVTATVLITMYLRPTPTAVPVPVASPGTSPASTGTVAAVSSTAMAPTGTAALTGTAAVTGTTTVLMGPASTGSAGFAEADDGTALAASGHLFQAQVRLSEALRAGIDGPKGKAVRLSLIDLGNRLQLSNQCLPEDPYSKSYTIVSGDSLAALSKKFLVPAELLMRVNGFSTSSIKAGQAMKVLQGPIHLEISKSRFELTVWIDKVCVRVYPVGIGAANKTPEGAFVVQNKVKNPKYEPQHKPVSAFKESGAPDNPLGTRWIDIGNHYGVHGTIDPTSIGRDASEGCIRMNNKDVEEVYDMVILGATKVTIKP
jgi:LysM repeat protein